MRLTVLPAHGRDYKSAKAVQEDFDSNKDFMICDMFCADNGRYINAAQLAIGDILAVRYSRKTKQIDCKKR